MTKKRNFTIIEILVVIGIIAILAGILVPTVISSLNRGRRTNNISNLKQLHIAMMYYAEDNNDFLPYLEVSPENSSEDQYNSQSLFLLLPYTGYNLEIFYPPIIFNQDKNSSTSDLNRFLSAPETLIPAIKAGTTDLMPGYAYSPVDNEGHALMAGFNDLSSDLVQEDTHVISPLACTYNRTYDDEVFILMADGSVVKEKGSPSNDSILSN